MEKLSRHSGTLSSRPPSPDLRVSCTTSRGIQRSPDPKIARKNIASTPTTTTERTGKFTIGVIRQCTNFAGKECYCSRKARTKRLTTDATDLHLRKRQATRSAWSPKSVLWLCAISGWDTLRSPNGMWSLLPPCEPNKLADETNPRLATAKSLPSSTITSSEKYVLSLLRAPPLFFLSLIVILHPLLRPFSCCVCFHTDLASSCLDRSNVHMSCYALVFIGCEKQ